MTRYSAEPAEEYLIMEIDGVGKIESGINYVQDNALKGRGFASLAEENQFLQEWENRVADTRIHGTTRQQVGQGRRADATH